MNYGSKVVALLLVAIQLATPAFAKAGIFNRWCEKHEKHELIAAKRFLTRLQSWIFELRSAAKTSPKQVLYFRTKGPNRWKTHPQISVAIASKADQILTSKNLKNCLGKAAFKSLHQGMEFLINQGVIDIGKPSVKPLDNAQENFVKGASNILHTIDGALNSAPLNAIDDSAVDELLSKDNDAAWKLILPKEVHEDIAVDYSDKGLKIKSISDWYLAKVNNYVQRWQQADTNRREEIIGETVKLTQCGDRFEVNIKLEILAHYLKNNAAHREAITELAHALDERFQKDKWKRRGYITLCAAGATVLVAGIPLFGFVAGTLVISWEAGITTILAALALDGMVLCGIGSYNLVKEAWAHTRRPPLEVIDLELRQKAANAIVAGGKIQVVEEAQATELAAQAGTASDDSEAADLDPMAGLNVQ